jgi:hypothetical protein
VQRRLAVGARVISILADAIALAWVHAVHTFLGVLFIAWVCGVALINIDVTRAASVTRCARTLEVVLAHLGVRLGLRARGAILAWCCCALIDIDGAVVASESRCTVAREGIDQVVARRTVLTRCTAAFLAVVDVGLTVGASEARNAFA